MEENLFLRVAISNKDGATCLDPRCDILAVFLIPPLVKILALPLISYCDTLDTESRY